MSAAADLRFRTLDEARTKVALANTQRLLMANAITSALDQARAREPGALARVTEILAKARHQHLVDLTGHGAVRPSS